MLKKSILLGFCGFCFLIASSLSVEAAIIESGKKVQFDYTLTVQDQVVETSEGKAPLEYTHGEGKIIPGLSKALEGLKVGDEKKVTIEPEEAYGPVIEDAIKDIPKANFPEDLQYAVGSVIQMQDTEGNTYPGIVWNVKEDSIVVNFNHPLAGQTLIFDVKIVSVE